MTSLLGVFFQTAAEHGAPVVERIKTSWMPWVKGFAADWSHNPFAESGQRVLARCWIQRSDGLQGDNYERSFYEQGQAGARAYFDLVRPQYDRLLSMGIRDVLGVNEPHPRVRKDEDTARFWREHDAIAQFSAQMVEYQHGHGMIPWTGCFGVGHPDIDVMPVYRQAIVRASQHGGGLVVHEYSAPELHSEGCWLTLRIKRSLRELAEVGIDTAQLRVIVGECGIDGGAVPALGTTRQGWRDWAGWVYPEGAQGLPQSGMTEERYWRMMSALDDAYQQIPQIQAVFPFVTHPLAQWASFDWGENLVRRSIAKHEQTEPEPPEPPAIDELDQLRGEVALLTSRMESVEAQLARYGTAEAFGLQFVTESN